jgi:hypothetical protein
MLGKSIVGRSAWTRPEPPDLRGWRYPGDHQPGCADRLI